MKVSTFAAAAAVGVSGALAQTFKFTDSNGIEFWQSTWDTTVGKGNAQWGLALPPATETGMKNEYIGHMVVPKVEAGTWMGLSHASGMTGGLLLVSWLDGEDVKTSFRYATGYTAPDIYTGNATLTMISTSSNDTHFEYTYRCEECWSWDQDGATGSQVPATTASAAQIVGWAQATNPPTTPSDDDSAIQQHANDGLFGALVASARNTAYTSWASLATATATANTPASTGSSSGNSMGTATSAVATATAAATSAVACPTTNTLANTTWDYIVVGAGAGGIPMADKLSESGASVLLIERGPPSSGRWGGTLKPEWLEGSNLTRFDVSGLDNEIWANSTGIACEDYSVMAGCVLGGGTAVNAGLWWRANPEDFDYNFPAGWKAADVEPAIGRVFDRIPFTDHPSMDGILYKPCSNNIVGGALKAYGFENITADDEPAKKNFTFSFPNHMFSHGERGGPMATYLVTAHERNNFKLIMNTAVDRVVRDGGRITGVETSAFLPGGQCSTVKVTPNTGKVILSAGAFGTPKILFRSGIGPQDQLEVVQGAEGSKMVNSSQWINLPVGYNLDDHTNTDIVIEHPDVSFYDFYAAYDDPIKSDAQKYLDSRSGILAQSAPNLGPFFWQEIVGDDGITRQLQWNGRVESGHDITSNKSMVLSQYLGRGHTSRGRTTITAALDMTVSQVPYLNNKHDVAAVAAGIETLKAVLAKDPLIKVVWGPTNQTVAEFLAAYPRTTGQRSANHWMGSCKMGTDSGLVNNGSAVVDTNARVYGTDNLFVVDASISPGMVSTNPSALIVSVAEHASQLIGKLAVGNSSNVAVNSTAPYPQGNSTTPQGTGYPSGTGFPTGTGFPVGTAPAGSSRCTKEITITRSKAASSAAVSTTVSAPVAVATSDEAGSSPDYPHSSYSRPTGSIAPFPSLNGTDASPTATGPTASGYASPTASAGSVAQWQRCGGSGYSGPTSCMEGLVCKEWNPYYSQCVSADQA